MNEQCMIQGDLKVLTPNLCEGPVVKGMLRYERNLKADDTRYSREAYQWYTSRKKEGVYRPLGGEHTETIVLLKEYAGQYLKCEWKGYGEDGTLKKWILSPSTGQTVALTEGNPLTDWMYEAGFGVSHHMFSDYVSQDYVAADERDTWKAETTSWNEYWEQFDVKKYAGYLVEMGVKFVIWGLGQNSGYFCAPNPVYDRMLREAGLLKEGEVNPKTLSPDNDIPMKVAGELKKHGIRVILYLPSNPPHSAHWNEEDYRITTEVFDYTPSKDTPATQPGKKALTDMVKWWSKHYGEMIAGWWFDGCYPGGVLEEQMDKTKYYNLSTLVNAAKAGNPYGIVSFNAGLDDMVFVKTNPYQDYTAGETQTFEECNVNGRWAPDTDDCQKFLWGPIGKKDNPAVGWGCPGLSLTGEFLRTVRKQAKRNGMVLCFDCKINVFGDMDSEQYDLLRSMK